MDKRKYISKKYTNKEKTFQTETIRILNKFKEMKKGHMVS